MKEFSMEKPDLEPCPICGSEQRTPLAAFAQTQMSGRIFLQQLKRKPSLFARKTNISPVTAITCLNCGYTVFFAVRVENLFPDA